MGASSEVRSTSRGGTNSHERAETRLAMAASSCSGDRRRRKNQTRDNPVTASRTTPATT